MQLPEGVTLKIEDFITSDGEIITLTTYTKRIGNCADSSIGTLENAILGFKVVFGEKCDTWS